MEIKHGHEVQGKSIPAQLTQFNWLLLPQEVRAELVVAFNISRSGTTHVEYKATPVVLSDGYTYEDLGAVSVAKMQAFTGSDATDFHKLFDLTMAKINTKQVMEEQVAAEVKQVAEEKAEEVKREHIVETLAKVGELATEVIKSKKAK